MKVKPTVPGSVVRFPRDAKRVLRDEGEDVPDGEMYWHRRLSDKSVTLVVEPTAGKPIARVTPVSVASAEEPAVPEPDEQPEPTGREPVTPITTR